MHRTDLFSPAKKRDLAKLGRTGVSLHCHSMYSKEMLDFLPIYAEKIPVISHFYKKEQEKYAGKQAGGINFETAFWSPPMTPQMIYDSEKAALNEAGLEAIVSLTDHDEISGCSMIDADVPVSLEWTVPFEIGFFHLGIHNMPKDRADEITQQLLDFTFKPELKNAENLNALFEMLDEIEETLIVFNHPLWDIEMIGDEKHTDLLQRFLAMHGHWIHALEVNGFRTWSENKAVLELAEQLGLPVVSGGDRHGCQSNTVVNITNSATFADFVGEVRIDGRSQVALMPEYERPLVSRQLASFAEILGTYPDFPVERIRWFDRVAFDINDGKGVVPLSAHGWKRGGPVWLRMAIRTMGALGSPTLLPLFRALRNRKDRVPANLGVVETRQPIAAKLRSEAA